jgi:glycosyltransferase involved in cell wall biosynthesis
LSQVGRTLRNLPLSTSVLLGHVQRGRAKGQSVVLRRLPTRARDRLTSTTVRSRRPDLAALALAAGGRAGEARVLLQDALARAGDGEEGARLRHRVAEAAVTLHQLDLAERALGAVPAELGDARLAALVAAGQGRLGAALVLLAGAGDARSRRLAGRLLGEVEVVRAEALREDLSAPRPPRRPVAAPVRVLHVVTNALPDRQAGYTIRTHGIVTAQRARGIDARVVSRLGFPVDTGVVGAPPLVTVDGVPYHRLLPGSRVPPPGRARQDLAVRELGALVERTGAELLHAHSKHDNAQVALRVARPLGLPVVYEARGFLEETWRTEGGSADSDFYRWSRESETLCMASADVVVTLAEAMRQDIVGRGIDPDRVVVVPNAVPESFTAPLPPAAAARERLGLPAEAFVLGTVTTLNDYEGIDTVVEALRLLDDPQFRLLVVGDGPARPRLEALAAPLGDRVRFTGRVPHSAVREHLAALDVFVVPRHETPVTALVPPIKPLEALAVGVPVLASDLPPLVEIVRPGSYGEIAAAGDAASWADQIASLGYAPEHVRALGGRAAAFVARERTWTAAVDRYDAAYAITAHR